MLKDRDLIDMPHMVDTVETAEWVEVVKTAVTARFRLSLTLHLTARLMTLRPLLGDYGECTLSQRIEGR